MGLSADALRLPKLATVVSLPADEQAALVMAAMFRTWRQLNGNTSRKGRRRFLAAWRAWVDEAERQKAADPEAYAAARRGLDFLESFTNSTDAQRN